MMAQWAQTTNKAATGQATLPYWLVNADDYIGQFVKYLVNDDVRDAVKKKMKEQLIPLTGADNCSVVAHSWGTVVAYESLLDLEKEAPDFHLANLFTLGSPLWLVQYWLQDPTGRKPSNVLVGITEELSPNVRMILKTLLNALLDGTVEVDRCPVCKVSQKQSTDFLPQGWRFALRSPQ